MPENEGQWHASIDFRLQRTKRLASLTFVTETTKDDTDEIHSLYASHDRPNSQEKDVQTKEGAWYNRPRGLLFSNFLADFSAMRDNIDGVVFRILGLLYMCNESNLKSCTNENSGNGMAFSRGNCPNNNKRCNSLRIVDNSLVSRPPVIPFLRINKAARHSCRFFLDNTFLIFFFILHSSFLSSSHFFPLRLIVVFYY